MNGGSRFFWLALSRLLWRGSLVLGVLGVGAPPTYASGYLTPMGQGVVLSSYVINNSVPPGLSTGMTLVVSGAIANPDACGATDKIHIPGTVPNYSALVAAVMAASAAGQSIGFWSSGCAVIPFWGGAVTYPQVWTLWVVQ